MAQNKDNDAKDTALTVPQSSSCPPGSGLDMEPQRLAQQGMMKTLAQNAQGC